MGHTEYSHRLRQNSATSAGNMLTKSFSMCAVSDGSCLLQTIGAFGSKVIRNADLRILSVLLGFLHFERADAAGGSDEESENSVCNDDGSFLGVGNPECLADNVVTSVVLVGIIVIMALSLEFLIHKVKSSVKGPQLRKIVERIFEEVMVLGFISMVFFAMGATGLTDQIAEVDGSLSGSELFRFKEFFHYIVFISMIYYILLVLCLLFTGTVVPRYLWYDNQGENRFKDCRVTQRMDLDQQTIAQAYNKLRKRYKAMGWRFTLNPWLQFEWWKVVEVLAYELCRDRSRPIYKNSEEMQRIFGLSVMESQDVTYSHYNKLMMRNILVNILELHWSTFLMLFLLIILNDVRVVIVEAIDEDYSTGAFTFMLLAIALFILAVVIMLKTFQILRGIVKDRLKLVDQGRVDKFRLSYYKDEEKKLTLRVLAIAVRFCVRMKLASLCHRALHSHDHRFWFGSPRFLLRLFHFATFGQAFFLMWLSLIEGPVIVDVTLGWLMLTIMIFLSFVVIFVVIPLTLPSLVLVLSLTEFFVEQNLDEQYKNVRNGARLHSRRIREDFIRENSRVREINEIHSDDNVSEASSSILTNSVRRIFSMPTKRIIHLADIAQSPRSPQSLDAETFADITIRLNTEYDAPFSDSEDGDSYKAGELTLTPKSEGGKSDPQTVHSTGSENSLSGGK